MGFFILAVLMFLSNSIPFVIIHRKIPRIITLMTLFDFLAGVIFTSFCAFFLLSLNNSRELAILHFPYLLLFGILSGIGVLMVFLRSYFVIRQPDSHMHPKTIYYLFTALLSGFWVGLGMITYITH